MTTTEPQTRSLRIALSRSMRDTDAGMLAEALEVLDQTRHNLQTQINDVRWTVPNRRSLDLHVTFTTYNGASPDAAATRVRQGVVALLQHSQPATTVRVYLRNVAGVEYPA